MSAFQQQQNEVKHRSGVKSTFYLTQVFYFQGHKQKILIAEISVNNCYRCRLSNLHSPQCNVQRQCFFKDQTFCVYGLSVIMWNFPVNLVGKLIHIRCKMVYGCLLSSEVICKFILAFSFNILS